jgi:hypothetical protein
MGERNRGDTGQAGTVTDNGRGASADKYQRESADELGKELGCDSVGHC